MSLSMHLANDIANAALTFYVRGKAMAQTIQDKPLLAWLRKNGQTFPSGKDNVSLPIKGVFMSDTSTFLQGYSEDDALAFTQSENIKRAEYPWKELHAGLIISWTELKKDGITVTDNQKTSEHSRVELTRLTGLLQDRLDDYAESWARAINNMLWRDGTQDSKAIPGVRSILTDTIGSGSIGGLDRGTYPYWNHRIALGIAVSASGQTLTKRLRSEVRQLRRYGGKPNKVLAGSGFIESAEVEVTEKGVYTQEGFTRGDATDITVANIRMRGVGEFEYDPTMDDLGLTKYAFFMDSRRLTLRPMEGEDNKMLTPERPYNYMVFLKSMTYTGALVSNQLNCHGVYSVA
jgi:hypothetical protein